MASRTKGKTVMEVGSDGVAVITLINTPVNYLSFNVLYNLKNNYEEALSWNDVKAIVITGMSGDRSLPYQKTEHIYASFRDLSHSEKMGHRLLEAFGIVELDTVMRRGRGKGKKQNATAREDQESGEEENIPAYKRRGRPHKPLKDEIEGEDELVDKEEEKDDDTNGSVTSKEDVT